MKRRFQLSAGSDAAFLWLACVAALCAGFYLAFGVLGAAIDREHDRTGRVSAIMIAGAEVVSQRAALQREERALQARLDQLGLRDDKPATVARFIRTAARIAAAQGVELVDIDERAAAPASALPPGASSGEGSALEAIPLDVTVSGTYRALLATICGLAQAPLTMQIEIASIEREAAASDASGGPLIARLHVDLQRLSNPPSLLTHPAHS